jgi:hypothetical protein
MHVTQNPIASQNTPNLWELVGAVSLYNDAAWKWMADGYHILFQDGLSCLIPFRARPRALPRAGGGLA